MPISRVCLACGLDNANAAPWREPHYGLLVRQCAGCGRIEPASNPATTRKTVCAWFRFARAVILTLLIIGIIIGVTALHESSLSQHNLDMQSFVKRRGHNLSVQRMSTYANAIADEARFAMPAAMRIIAGTLAGVWCLLLPSRRRFWRSLFLLWTIATAIVVADLILDHGSMTSGGRWRSSLSGIVTQGTSRALALAGTCALAAPVAIFKGLGIRFAQQVASRRFRKRLRKARRRRDS
jgi:branched-subunit amino acid transport protein